MKLKVKEIYAQLAAANQEHENKRKAAEEKGENGYPEYGKFFVRRQALSSFLSNCELEIKIPESKKKFIA